MTEGKSEIQATGKLFQLPASLTIADVADVHAALLSELAAATPLDIDAAQVELVDTAGLQLLAAVRKAAIDQGLVTTLRDPSEALRRAAEQIGLGILLTWTTDWQGARPGACRAKAGGD